MRKILTMGLVLARAWGGQAVGTAPAERLKLWRQMAAAAGKEESVALSLYMEVYNLEVEETLSTMAALLLGGRCVYEQMVNRTAAGMQETDLRSADMETSWRTCRSGYARNS